MPAPLCWNFKTATAYFISAAAPAPPPPPPPPSTFNVVASQVGGGESEALSCPLLLTEPRSQQQAPTLSPATLFIIAASAADCLCPLSTQTRPIPPLSLSLAPSRPLARWPGQQFAPMLQVGDIATDTSRFSLAGCLKFVHCLFLPPSCLPTPPSRRSQ